MNTFPSYQLESKMTWILGWRVIYFGILIVPVNPAQVLSNPHVSCPACFSVYCDCLRQSFSNPLQLDNLWNWVAVVHFVWSFSPWLPNHVKIRSQSWRTSSVLGIGLKTSICRLCGARESFPALYPSFWKTRPGWLHNSIARIFRLTSPARKVDIVFSNQIQDRKGYRMPIGKKWSWLGGTRKQSQEPRRYELPTSHAIFR
jgi:hypothetical protein